MKYTKEHFSQYTLDIQSTVLEAKSIFDKNQATDIIVLDDKKFVGLLSLNVISSVDETSTLSDVAHLMKSIFLRENFSLFDWLKLSSIYKTSFLPLVSEDDMIFIGMLSPDDILEKFENTGLNVENSTVLVIKKSSKAFSYSQVFQIAEANAAKIFGSYIHSSDVEETEIVLSIYHMGLNELLQSYRRYDYEIVSYHEEDLHHETLKANSEYFSKYITV